MKTMKEKLYFGILGGAVLIPPVCSMVSLLFNADWYFYLPSPFYLYQQFFAVGWALGEFNLLLPSTLILCSLLGGVLLGFFHQCKWSATLLLPFLIIHTIGQACVLLINLWMGVSLPCVVTLLLSFLLSLAFLLLYYPITKHD